MKKTHIKLLQMKHVSVHKQSFIETQPCLLFRLLSAAIWALQ